MAWFENDMSSILCQCLTLSLQQTVTGLSALQLAVHLTQYLPGWEDGFPL
jgi:hypothetical protein